MQNKFALLKGSLKILSHKTCHVQMIVKIDCIKDGI
jgi:hypothetical protein